MKRKNYPNIFRKLLLLIAVFSFLREAGAQVSGVKNIPGSYATIEAAILDMNTNGIGAGGVTVNISAGYIETISVTLSLTATGTASAPIVFRKNGSGANPRINAYTGGTGVPGSSNMDGIWRLVGSDYVTIDGIDLAENAANTSNPATMEYGYGLFKKSAADGCQHVTIQNCNISLSVVNNEFSATLVQHEGSTGICMVNAIPSVLSVPVPPSRQGTNSYNAFYHNTITQCNTGISLSGYADIAPYTLSDTLNDIGGTSAATGNSIINFGGAGGAVNGATGIRVTAQVGVNISYNTINNNNGPGVNHSQLLYGIFIDATEGIYTTCTNNQVSIKSNSLTEDAAGIMVAGKGEDDPQTGLIRIGYNTIDGCENLNANYSGGLHGVYAQGVFSDLTVEHNVVRNISLGASTATLYGIRLNTGNYNVQRNEGRNKINNNQVYALSTSGTGSLYGIHSKGMSEEYIDHNVIYNLQHNATVSGQYKVAGIFSTGEDFQDRMKVISISGNEIHDLYASANFLSSDGVSGVFALDRSGRISKNTIYNLSGQCADITGVHVVMRRGVFYFMIGYQEYNMHVTHNKIYDLLSSATATRVSGIAFRNDLSNIMYKKTTNGIVDNNVVGRLYAPQATADNAIRGIEINQLTDGEAKVYFNTVSLNAPSGGTDFGSSGIYTNKAATNFMTGVMGSSIEMKNNLISNTSVASGTGLTVAYRKSGVMMSGTDHLPSSDNNLFYAGIPDSAHLLLYDEANIAQTMMELTAALAPAEALFSFSSNVTYADTNGFSPDFLAPDPGLPTRIESGAANISGFETDIDGNIRAGNTGYTGSASFPDIGAYERVFTLLDVSGPLIVYHSPGAISDIAPRFVKAEIKDLSGVNTTSGKPAVYYKKGFAGTYFRSSGTLESGNAINGKWSFPIDPLNVGGVIAGDSIYYFIAAQDISINNYLSSFPEGATGTVNSIVTYPASPNMLLVKEGMSGNYLIGASQLPPNYTTITAALNDLNGKIVTGNMNLLLQADYQSTSEPGFPIVFAPFTGADDAYTVTLKPDANVNATIEGMSMPTSSIIEFIDDAANYVIDGSNNGTDSRNLTLRNTQSIVSCVVRFNGSAPDKGTRDIQLKNTRIEGGGEDYFILGVGIGSDIFAFLGASHKHLLISNNLIEKCWIGVMQLGIDKPADDITVIEKNTIRGLGTTPDNVNMQTGIFVYGTDKDLIDRNRISNSTQGISMANRFSNSTVSNNVIHNVMEWGIGFAGGTPSLIYNDSLINNAVSGSWQYGIYLPDLADNIKVYHNTVMMRKDKDMNISLSLIIVRPGAGMDIRNNIFSCHIPQKNNMTTASAIMMVDYNLPPAVFDYNVFFVDSPGSPVALDNITNKFVYTLGDLQTLTNSNFNSLQADPFFNGPANLVLLPNSPVIGKGVPIPGVSTDLNGGPRSATAPSIGAYEMAADVSGPSFSNASITDTSVVANRTVAVGIRDFSGVDVAANLPRIYYKKTTDKDTFGINNASADGWKWVAASDTSSPFEFDIDHSLLNGGGVITGDSIQYFFVAGDLISNVGSSPEEGFSGTVTAVLSAPADPGMYAIVGTPMNGSYTVGTGGIYPDLTSAVADVKTRGLSGNVSLEIVSSIAEPASVVFTEWKEFGTGNYTISVVPSALNPLGDTIMASVNGGPVLTIDGADRVIIDGRLNNAGNYLTVINQSFNPYQTCIYVKGPNATDITIRNINAATGNIEGSIVINIVGEANDRISILNNVLMKAAYGIQLTGFSPWTTEISRELVVSGNRIGSDTSINYITTKGISVKGTPGAMISDNDIFNIVNTTIEGAKGIEILDGQSAVVVKNNRVKNVSNSYRTNNNSVGRVYGIEVSGDSVQVVNNDISGISNVQTPQWIGHGPCGIMVMNGNATSIIHNSVNIYGGPVPGGNPGNRTSAALAFRTLSSGAIVENNILANSATGTGTVNSYCIYAPDVSFTSVDHNNYDTTGAGTGAYIGMGSSACRSLNDWKTFSKQDAHSLCVASGFTSMDTLMIATAGTPNALESGAKIIASVTTDRLGKSRPYTTPTTYGGNTAPDMGAYEFDGAGDDRLAPFITLVNPPKRSISLTGQTVEANITDAGSGVSASFRPRVYFKRSSDANVWIGNNPTDSGWKWEEASNTASPFSFYITYAMLFNGTVSNGDVIQYFIVAQDQSLPVNVGASSGSGFSATSVSNILSFPSGPSSYSINTATPLNGVYDVGISGAYPTITAALADLDIRGVSGAVTFRLTDSSYGVNETFPLTIGEVIDASAINTVTIKPAPGVKPVISSSASEIFLIAADASFVVIDGSNNNTGSRDLSVINTSVASSDVVVTIEGGHIVIKNLVIKGGSSENEAGIKIKSGNARQQPVSILNNLVYHVNAGILSDDFIRVGDILVEDNTIGTDSAAYFIRQYGINITRAKSVVINRNRIYNIKTADLNVQSIGIGSGWDVLSSVVSNNVVTGVHSKGGMNGSTAAGIMVGGGNKSTDSVYNNMVSDIITSNDNSMGTGIYINSPGDRMVVYHNTVHLSGQPSTGNGTSRSAALFVSYIYNTPQVEFRNNMFSNTMVGVKGGSVHNAIVIQDNSLNGFISDYNNFYTSGAHGMLLTAGASNQQYNTLAGLKRILGTDANSRNEEVHFVSSTDLHLVTPSNGNTALAARPVSVTKDIDNNTRSIAYPYMGAHEASIPVPVKMTAFNALLSGNDVFVKWTTASELNNRGFTIERSVDNKSFEAIGYVKGKGNSAVTSVYRYNDVNAFANKQVNTLYYRLRQHDMNGDESISAVAIVQRKENKEAATLLVYPNPVSDVVTIALSQNATGDIEITDLMGRVVKTAKISNSETQIDVASLDAGIYLVRIKGNISQVMKLMKQN